MTANNAIHQSQHQWVTSMSTALCGQMMASFGKTRPATADLARLRETFKDCLVTIGLPPPVFREGELRFFFFSRQEPRPHVHVSHPDGEAKFGLSPTVELARNIGLSSPRIKEAERLVETRQQASIDAWSSHFRS